MVLFFNVVRRGIAWLIGSILWLAAIGELLGNRHFAEVLAQWQLFPSWSLLTLGVLASLSELVLALSLISGWRLAAAALLAAAFHLAYIRRRPLSQCFEAFAFRIADVSAFFSRIRLTGRWRSKIPALLSSHLFSACWRGKAG